ncbi:class I SAM-dependent methyltransferase [Streptomyces jumonjinensis]|uniref:Class I SAM-dependent methyltransferase n=1 Tax=Streptomyces jumonjinensis TaxID=1945 RepID=A0A646KFP1_STRJU|nr:class I SAM-dependent methyltransferase [Streptomyces jumonjinensis]MQT00880.1 class I SAM-dependent methyltransferase [Streptomyces jumonjinensis]
MSSTQRFYDELAVHYDLMYADWNANIADQGAALDGLISKELGAGDPAALDVLDCACGIGTQSIGLTARGYRVIGTDLSAIAAARARAEAGSRGLRLATAAADMRALPFPDAAFDVVVCADNALPHLLTEAEAVAALREMRRVIRPGGLLLLSTRPYDRLRRERPEATPPQVRVGPEGRVITFQLWHWHPDGERYDFELFHLLPEGDGWTTLRRQATYWALPQESTARFVSTAGFTGPVWHEPERSGFFQPLLTARAPGAAA